MSRTSNWNTPVDPIEERLRYVDVCTSEALKLDGEGKSQEAITKYRTATDELEKILNGLNPTSPQYISLRQHQRSILERILLLEQSLQSGYYPTYEDARRHSSMGDNFVSSNTSSRRGSNANTASPPVTGTKTLTTAGVLGGVSGAILLGPIGLVAGGALAAYCATRDDAVGDTTRGISKSTIAGVEKIKNLDHKHNITGQAKDAAYATVQAAKKINDDYKITEKISTSANKVWNKVKDIEGEYQVTDKVTSGVTKGFHAIGAFAKKISNNMSNSGRSDNSTSR